MQVLSYRVCDVFTDRPLAGNALAVFTDAATLDAVTMQALAREMNLSETSFVLPPANGDADARIRIFTPTMELPFAGHPTLGTAFVLGGLRGLATLRLETARGVVTVTLRPSGEHTSFGWMTQPLPRIEPYAYREALLEALRVKSSGLPVELYDNGPHYVFVELETPEAIATLRPDLSRLHGLGSTAFSVLARRGDRWKCRVFAPGEGIAEDPATGAAAGPMAVHLARHDRIQWGEEIIIEQGAEVGRPSTLHARAVWGAKGLDRVEVGGASVLVARGELLLQTPEASTAVPGVPRFAG
jgi:trans-2,3-dihydro-3-hydroxyanthranilate isomerase